jgi:ankyrin repeat protein
MQTFQLLNAIKGGNLSEVKELHNKNILHKKAIYYAVKYGRLDCLRYLHENGYEFEERSSHTAAKYGNISCLKYLYEHKAYFDEITFEFAGRHLDCLKYLHEIGCPCDDDGGSSYIAIKSGNVECLEYLHKNGCKLINEHSYESIITIAAAFSKNLKCLKYLLKNGYVWDEDTFITAVISGKLSFLIYANKNGGIVNKEKCILTSIKCKKYKITSYINTVL